MKHYTRIKGIAFRKDEKIFVNKKREQIKNLNSIPFPEWSLFPMERYIACLKLWNQEKDERGLGILTSRGCTNRCNFCYRMEKGLRKRAIRNVIEEMRALSQNYGVSYFWMQDELFVSSKKRIFEFRDALKKNRLEIKFACDARVNLIDQEIVDCLKDCGCQLLDFGIESVDQIVLDRMNKKTTVEQNIKAVELVRKANIGMNLNLLWGNIGDTKETLKKAVEFIKTYTTYDIIRTIRPVTPYPGCDLYYEAIKRGLLFGPEDFFDKFKNSDLLTVNFTDISEKEFYHMLFEANQELILDHTKNSASFSMEESNNLIEGFKKLYFQKDYKFRGARHYVRESS